MQLPHIPVKLFLYLIIILLIEVSKYINPKMWYIIVVHIILSIEVSIPTKSLEFYVCVGQFLHCMLLIFAWKHTIYPESLKIVGLLHAFDMIKKLFMNKKAYSMHLLYLTGRFLRYYLSKKQQKRPTQAIFQAC